MTDTDHIQPYSVFTKAYDEVFYAATYMAELEKDETDYCERLKAHLVKITEGVAAPEEIPGDTNRPVTLMFDCSGSMLGETIHQLLPALLTVGDKLHAEGRVFEILGYTTRSWKGGSARKDWMKLDPRPSLPGRLCELRHIVFKGHKDDWSDVRLNLAFAFIQGALKENVDGESLEWASGRSKEMTAIYGGPTGGIVMISDGAPVDDSTLGANRVDLLKDHLLEVKAQVSRKMPLAVIRVGYLDNKNNLHPDTPYIGSYDRTTDKDRSQAITRMVEGITQAIGSLSNTAQVVTDG